MTFGRIVLGSDGSPASEALTVAAALAGKSGASLDIVHPGPTEDVLAPLVASAVDAGLPETNVAARVHPGDRADALAAVAEELDAGLIVLERGGERPSHIVHRLSHEAPCDVLVVAPRPHDPETLYASIAIATDGSATADRAARRGYDLGRALGAKVNLVFVGHPATGELISNDTISVYGEDVETTVHLLEGDPTMKIVEATSATESDLVVVGNKGLTGLRGAILGSVPKGVLDDVKTDVLVCRTVRQIESELAPGEGGVIERHGEQLATYRDEDGEVHSYSARCTHMGCLVGWNPTSQTFDCPCHGSQFGPDGSVVNGPATRPLPPA